MIEVRGLSRYYGEHRAIEALDFNIGSNEIVGFLGLNGAGKTTTLRILAGLLLPTRGTVSMDGQDLFSAPLEMRRRIGFLPEVAPLYHEMVVRDFLRFTGELRGMDQGGLDDAIDEVAARTDLQDHLHRVVGTLSYGFQKRVGIAQAILHRPSLVILDEPIGGLDPVQIVEMREVIAGLRQTCTVLVSSHILSEVSQTCDRLMVMKDGRIVAQGTEAELSNRATHATRLLLELRGEEGAVRETLAGLAQVAEHKLEARAGGRILANVTLTGDHREELVRRLVEAGFGIRRVEDAEAELEQIFLQLTRKGAA